MLALLCMMLWRGILYESVGDRFREPAPELGRIHQYDMKGNLLYLDKFDYWKFVGLDYAVPGAFLLIIAIAIMDRRIK